MFPPRGPLADLLDPLATGAPEPIETMGRALGLRGTVRVAALLDAMPVPARPPASANRSGADPLWRLVHIRALALRPLRAPFTGRHALADAARTGAAIRAAGLIARRRRRNIDALAQELGGEFHRMIGARIDIARAATAELRQAVGDRLRTLGPAAAYLEQLDATIREYTDDRAAELCARVPPALQQRFADQLWDHIRRLPDDPDPADPDGIGGWYARRGWIDDHLRTCRRALAGVCRHEARALEGLVAAADEVAIDMETST